ncbi:MULTISPECIES: DUF1372 family protein [Streptococcus]|uniref:Phage protein n=1 Tax=Streptococcus equi subsp. zooepidemicus Sz4is TaxID=1381082 RepID=A0AAW3GN48_STRSZ|nr:DUF1372 family protein [Streptococcus dysgalactiae]KIS17988.1 phage protein [Streptococcus equi subsp. zooepidemicus Sz4is]
MKYRTILDLTLFAVYSAALLFLGMTISKLHYTPQVTILRKQVVQLEARKPVVIYQVDNTGGNLVGKVTDKSVVDEHYTVTIGVYGKFLVTKEQFDNINIGDDAPDYLKHRGS